MMTVKPMVRDILKTDGIYHFQANQSLSQVLPKLTSGHDAAFIFDEKDTFLGVISPYYLFKSRSNTGTTKLRNCVKMPPKLDPQDNLVTVATHMLESNIYFLPVLAGPQFLGITTITRLLQYVVDHRLLNGNGHLIFSKGELITVAEETQVDQALAVMREKKITKLPVVNRLGKLVGILSQYDTKDLVPTPQSFGKGNRIGEKEPHAPVKNFMTKMVEVVDRVPSFAQAVEIMLTKGIGSLVIVDDQGHPLSIVTKRDLLQTIATLE